MAYVYAGIATFAVAYVIILFAAIEQSLRIKRR